jgi:signal transduction histidine kinase
MMDPGRALTDEQLLGEIRRRITLQRSTDDAGGILKEIGDLSARLRTAEEAKSYFLSNIRNEINNPLSSILGLSKAIADGALKDPERVQQMAAHIHKDAFSLDFQIRNIIAAAEIESGELAPNPSSNNITSLIEGIVAMFELRIKQRQINVKVESPDKELVVQSDPYMLHTMVANLLANAIQFSFPATEVLISVRKSSENALVLRVKDHGLGITPADQKQLFSRFHQVDTGRTKQHEGHGLGLAIVNEFADALGGGVAVRSEKGEGAEFIVTLPLIAVDKATQEVAMSSNTVLFGEEEKF